MAAGLRLWNCETRLIKQCVDFGEQSIWSALREAAKNKRAYQNLCSILWQKLILDNPTYPRKRWDRMASYDALREAIAHKRFSLHFNWFKWMDGISGTPA